MQCRALAWALLALSLLASCGGALPSDPAAASEAWHKTFPLFSTTPPPGMECAPSSAIPTEGLELSAEERELLQYICWPVAGGASSTNELRTRRGIPPGVTCEPVTWCDGDVCTEVCGAGTVAVEPWLHNAIKLQAALAREMPFCFSQLLGTHNSGITLANGYGNLDPFFQEYFKYIKWAVSDFSDAPLRTNDQWLSLTDQLNLGVRALELDAHWVGGALRIAHCGGFHLEPLNQLIRAINLVAKLLHKHIRWDTETLGCIPSLSSIPALEQRLLVDSLAEIKAWMDAPGNEDEFVVLFFDDQPDLMSWGVEEHLVADFLSVFSADQVFSTEDYAAYAAAHGPGTWPSAAKMRAAGRRLLLVSREDYGAAMRPLIFSRDSATVCSWNEPELSRVAGVPDCVVTGRADPSLRRPLFSGSLVRVETCELEYGPLNCDFVFRGSNEPFLDEATLPALLGCGLSQPAPDLLTPSKAAAAIWTWAPGHPYEQVPAAGSASSSGGGGGGVAGMAQQFGSRQQQARLGVEQLGVATGEANCAAISASDGRWRAVPCNQALPSACRAGASSSAGSIGAAAAAAAQWVLPAEGAARGACPPGAAFDFPRHPVDNYRLVSLLRESGAAAAWLPITGPDWAVPLGVGTAGQRADD